MSQKFHVLWGNHLAEGFHVTNGVRQSGIRILSPYLFNAYTRTDDLSIILDQNGVGCHYLGSVNHLCYAEDIVLLSPTTQGLQTLIDSCVAFADCHDIVFNTRKTACMAILPTFLRRMVLPEIILYEVLDYVDNPKYPGYLLSNSVKVDDLELQHQYRLLCCRANSLIGKFAMCSFPVKKCWYRAYCAYVYGVHLWQSFRVSVLCKFIACFNNAAWMFSGLGMLDFAVLPKCLLANKLITLMHRINVLGALTQRKRAQNAKCKVLVVVTSNGP